MDRRERRRDSADEVPQIAECIENDSAPAAYESGAQPRRTHRQRSLRHPRLMPGGYHGPIGTDWRCRDQSAEALNHTVKRSIYLEALVVG